MVYKLFVKVGSYQLASFVENGLKVYRLGDNYYIESTFEEVEKFQLQSMIEPSHVDIAKLTKVLKPTSIFGLWSYYLALKHEGK